MSVTVVKGLYNEGDLINGKRIILLTDSWTENVACESHFGAQSFNDCKCGEFPVYAPSKMCEFCIHEEMGKPVEFCKAILEAEFTKEQEEFNKRNRG